jgi:hypothetical protein
MRGTRAEARFGRLVLRFIPARAENALDIVPKLQPHPDHLCASRELEAVDGQPDSFCRTPDIAG